jgi:uncharacterized membrane protein (UPF0182 family)
VTDDYASEPADTSAGRVEGVTSRRRVLLPTVLTAGVLLFLLAIFTGVWTDKLWFESVGFSDVFRRLLITRVLLFTVLGLVFATAVAANIVIAYRLQPLVPIRARRFDPVARYREVITPIRGRVVAGIFLLLAVTAGSIGSGHWQEFMLWRNRVSFGQQDVYGFGKDIGFFVFDYPWYRFLLSYGFSLLIVCILAAGVTHYLYGGITLQGRDRVSSSAQAHLSVLLGLFMLLKAVAYYMDRFGLAISEGGLFTGISFTDDNARIPAKNILMVIALICAVLFFANVVRRSLLLPGLGLGLLVLSSILIGGIFPAVMQWVQVRPNVPDKERPYITQNIGATREAYGVSDVQVQSYDAQTNLSLAELTAAAESTPGTRLLDPTLVSPAFEQLQQVRGYYSMPQTLDVDRYPVEGQEQPQDMVIAGRELNLDGLQDSQRSWNNDHTVYTHGLGVVAAFGNERGDNGQPVWAVEDLPPRATEPSLEITQPRIYFGEDSPQYSIVGQPEGVDTAIEVDIPQVGADDTAGSTTTYTGTGGVPLGGLFAQTLYAMKFGEPNILLSGRVNSASQILYDRDPRERVSKVAPWLTVDGNSYPAVVDGRIVWIVDAYTASASYPGSQLLSLEDATSDSLTDQGSYATLPNDQVNYMRNSVKAVVDAYDGTVTLYAWDESDPVLRAWQSAFPGSVTPRSEISPDLLAHLRYPEDLFKVQRDILTTYHVTDPLVFNQGDQRWQIPVDPTNTDSTQPPYYLSVQRPDETEPKFSLTSVYLPNGRENLAAFISVNSEASDTAPEGGYGSLQILQLPTVTTVPGPSQMANQLQNDSGVTDALLSFKQTGTQVLFGNLLTLPVGNKLLYVQPVYTQRSAAEGTYPVLQFVIASFGDDVGFGRSLDEALKVALGETPGPITPPEGDDPPPSGSGDVVDLLNQAQAKYDEAQQALADQDLTAYQAAINEMNDLIEQAAQALAEEAGTPTTEPTPTETPSP